MVKELKFTLKACFIPFNSLVRMSIHARLAYGRAAILVFRCLIFKQSELNSGSRRGGEDLLLTAVVLADLKVYRKLNAVSLIFFGVGHR